MASLPVGRVPAELGRVCRDEDLAVLRTSSRDTRFVKRINDGEIVVIDHTGVRTIRFPL
jgi:hypothetical protein